MRAFCKTIFNALALVIVWPSAAMCWLERHWNSKSEEVYLFWAHFMAMAPGLPGVYLRRAFYRLTLDSCHPETYFGFGTVFTHRAAVVEAQVFVGSYALIGSAILRQGCLIGSRASLLSGGHLHELDSEGIWSPADLDRLEQIEIGEGAWLGENVTVIASVGARSMLSAGSVVATPVPARVMVAGNPARFVKRLEITDTSQQADTESGVPSSSDDVPSSVAATS